KALKSQLGKELNHLGIDTTKINIYKNFLILVTIIIILLYFINNGWIISIHRIGDILASYSGLFLILIIILPYLKSSYINSGTNIKMTLLVIVIFLELISSYVYYFVILLVIGIILILIAEYFAKAVLVENYEKRLTKEIENEKNELYKKEKQQ
ncbi:MAG: hypothetical protein GWP09_01880, partial [Nitrospiraceae bacterium]|nr:hypothetical protein [Nitrospiraceae bacterium]